MAIAEDEVLGPALYLRVVAMCDRGGMPEAELRPRRQAEELISASSDLLYEVERFFGCWALLSEGWPVLELLGLTSQEAAGVAFLVHARSLTYVFFPHRPRPDDVVAPDFLEHPATWQPATLATRKEVTAIQRWVSRDVAHVSYRRLARGSDRRDYVLIHAVLRRAISAFIAAAPAAVVIDGFHDAVAAAARLNE